MNKTLGKVQLEVLEYVGQHPNTLILPISKALGKDRKNINENIHILKKKGYIEKGENVESEKGAPYPSYHLTLKGAAYVYAYSENKKAVLVTVKNVEETYETYSLFKHLINILPSTIGLKLIHEAGRAQLSYGENFWDEQNFTQVLLLLRTKLSNSEMRELKRAVKNIPELKEDVLSLIEEAKRSFLADENV